MQDARPVLDRWLSNDHYAAPAGLTAKAYAACDEFVKGNAVTEAFIPGMTQRAHLINAFVQHQLWQFANQANGFTYEFKLNEAKNCWHLQIYKGGLVLTAHFLGRKSERKQARAASYRALLASRNLDLFGEDNSISSDTTCLYCHLLHGGWIRPEAICLAIPTFDQSNISHTMALDIPEAPLTESEQIREEMIFRLIKPLPDEAERETA